MTTFAHHSRRTLAQVTVESTEAGSRLTGIGHAVVLFKLTTVSVESQGTLAHNLSIHFLALSTVLTGIRLTRVQQGLTELSRVTRTTGTSQLLPRQVSACGSILTRSGQTEIQLSLTIGTSESLDTDTREEGGRVLCTPNALSIVSTCVWTITRMSRLWLTLREQFGSTRRVMFRWASQTGSLVVFRLVLPWWTLFAIRHETLDDLLWVVRVLGQFLTGYRSRGTLLNALLC